MNRRAASLVTESLAVEPSARVCFDLVYDRLWSEYQKSNQPVTVNFRKLVNFNSGVDRATHLIHPYPAKLLLNIPYFFLNCSQISAGISSILDPFCGSGTVLLEGILAGVNAYGADANPLARLIAKVKTTRIGADAIMVAYERLVSCIPEQAPPVNIAPMKAEHWFSAPFIRDLSRLICAINEIQDINIRNFFELCFSVCVRRVSYANPRLSVPVRLTPERYPAGHPLSTYAAERLARISATTVLSEFDVIVRANAKRVATLAEGQAASAAVISHDARRLAVPLAEAGCRDGLVDLVITSPPYVGAQKYIRASSLSLCWLGMCDQHELRPLERQNIGREHYSKKEYELPLDCIVPAAKPVLEQIRSINPLRAHIASNYLLEMGEFLAELSLVVQSGGTLILIIGDNKICGMPFLTHEYVSYLCEQYGFKKELILVDDIRSRGLMTKRNKTASVISSEWIFVFRRI